MKGKTAMLKRPSRSELRSAGIRRRRNTNLLLIGGGVVLAAVLVLVIAMSIRSQMPVGEEQFMPTQGNSHISPGAVSPIEYNSIPPTSGPHYGGLAAWGIHREPQRYELLVHNMEDGGIVIYYQCEDGCPEVVSQLESLVNPYLLQRRHIAVVPNDPTWTDGGPAPLHKDMESRIALTSWQRIDKFDDFDAERIQNFIGRYEGIDQHR